MPPRAYSSLFVGLYCWVVLLQWWGQAYGVAPAVHGDEPAHLVTGLMVRDWIASGFSGSPMDHAVRFYLHYPKVAFGHWPPVFYVVEAFWLLVFPASRAGVLLLMAALAAGLGLRIAMVLGPGTPVWTRIAAAFLFVSLSPIVEHSRLVMADILLSWLCFEAMLAFHRWIQAPSHKAGVWFSLWSILAILTKVTALSLALLPIFALAITRRWSLIRERSLWVSGALVGLFTAPWYLFVPGARHEAVAAYVGVPGTHDKIMGSFRLFKWAEDLPALVYWLGPLLLLALWGMWRDRESLARPGLIVASWVASVLAFRFIVLSASYEDRTLVPMLAPLMLCAAAMAPHVSTLLPLRSLAAAGTVVAVFATMGVARMPSKSESGVEDLARWILQRPEFRNTVILVVSDTFREGAFIAEMALGEQRPGHYVLRATKVLAESNWNGNGYKLLAATPDEVLGVLDRVPIGMVVFDRNPRRMPEHQTLVGETLAKRKDRLQPVTLPAGVRAGTFEVYRVTGNENRTLSNLSIRSLGLGRRIESK